MTSIPSMDLAKFNLEHNERLPVPNTELVSMGKDADKNMANNFALIFAEVVSAFVAAKLGGESLGLYEKAEKSALKEFLSPENIQLLVLIITTIGISAALIYFTKALKNYKEWRNIKKSTLNILNKNLNKMREDLN